MSLTRASHPTSDLQTVSHRAIDLELARRLERAEGMAAAAFVDARRAVQPDVGAEWTEVAGVYALFDGATSPITQTFGLGVFDTIGVSELERLETFFADRGAPTQHEICAFATSDVWSLLSARGYAPIETSTVLIRTTADNATQTASNVTTRLVDEPDAPLWASVSGEGWSSEGPELGAMVEQLGAVVTRARGTHCFLAEVNGRPIAAGALNVHNGIALLAGASTVSSARRQGAQAALLRARLAFARSLGLDLAMIVAQPGSASQRNAIRQGFRPVYVRSKWQRS